MIAPVPVHCFSLTFINKLFYLIKRYFCIVFYNADLVLGFIMLLKEFKVSIDEVSK